MEKISIIMTPALTMLLVGLMLPWINSMRQRAEKKAVDDKCVCYPRSSVIALWVLFGVAVLLTVAVLVCTILSIVNPEMMDTSDDDIVGIIFTWVLSIAVDAFTIVASIMFTRKITYNIDSFTDIKSYNKKHEYFYRDITKIENTVKANPTCTVYGEFKGMKGKLKIYFGDKCIKIPAQMLGVTEFIAFLKTQCPNLDIS